MTIWLYMLAAVCGAGSAFILATVLAMLIPLGLWPTLAGLSVFVGGAGLASAVWAIRYDHLSREMMNWHIEQMKQQHSHVPEMMMKAFRDMQARGMIPEGVEFSIGDMVGNVEDSTPPPPAPDKKLN